MPEAKTKQITDKLRGGYYTPEVIAEFICNWAIDSIDLDILEPSCGDGNFLIAAIKRLMDLGAGSEQIEGRLKGIELIKGEAKKALERTSMLGVNSDTIINGDFFSCIDQNKLHGEYDVIVGNPPFIRYQNFPEEHRRLAISLMQEMGLNPNRLTNIWVPFLVISASMLKKGGKLGMVIPAELFQVKYAAETRVFLSKFFDRISIVTFRKLVFKGIQQEVVLLLCERDVVEQKGIKVWEVENLDELKDFNIDRFRSINTKEIYHNSEKWTKYFLNQNEINLLRRLRNHPQVKPISDFASVDVGIVTGRNEFFMLSQETAEEWDLLPFTQRVVTRSPHLKGLFFTREDFKSNLEHGHRALLFLPPNEDFEDLPDPCKRYIEYGEKSGFNTGYKCRIRKRWFITPSLWTPEGFALRQVHGFPKLIVNQAEASSTDTVHRVRTMGEVSIEQVSIALLNSLTFAFSEISGRSYGGGVLTFEPTEVEDLPIVISNSLKVDMTEIDSLLRKKEIDKVLDIIDRKLLIDICGFSEADVKALRRIWEKMRDRRLYRK